LPSGYVVSLLTGDGFRFALWRLLLCLPWLLRLLRLLRLPWLLRLLLWLLLRASLLWGFASVE
jgi:hypothetical protein